LKNEASKVILGFVPIL